MLKLLKRPTDEERAERARRAELEADAIFYADQIPNSLARMRVASITKENKRVRINKVKVSDVLAMDDFIMLLVDTARLPFGLKIKDLSDPDVLKTLGGACRTPVDYEYTERAGFWYLIERRKGYGAIPRLIKYADALALAPAGNRWTFIIGVGANKRVITADLRRTPNLVMAGSVGAGKTVELKQIILSLCLANSPRDLRVVITDFKDGVDYKTLETLPHLGTPSPVNREKTTDIDDDGEMVDIITDDYADRIITEPEQLLSVLRYARREVSRRNKIIANAKEANNIDEWNARYRFRRFPRLMICIDEIAVAMLELPGKQSKEIETLLSGIARLGRAPGVHLFFGTQSVTSAILTATINHNFTARIAGYCATGPQSGLALGTGSYAATRIEPVAGRGIWRDGLHEVEIQMPYLPPKQVVEMLGAIKEKWNEPEEPIEMQLFRWALTERAGSFAIDDVYNEFRGVVTKPHVEEIGRANEYNGEDGPEIEIPGYDEPFFLLPAVPGALPRRLVAESELETSEPDTPKYDVTPEELFRYAIENCEGRFSWREIYSHFEKNIPQSEVKRISKEFEGKEIKVDGEIYKLEPGRGKKPKMLVGYGLWVAPPQENDTDQGVDKTEPKPDDPDIDEDDVPDWLQ